MDHAFFGNEFNALDPFHHFVAELILHSESQQSAINFWQRMSVYFQGEEAFRLINEPKVRGADYQSETDPEPLVALIESILSGEERRARKGLR